MMVSAHWRNTVVAACSIALVAVLSGCGAERYDPDAQGPTTTPSAEPTSTPTAGDTSMSMPVMLKRTGGFAGFNDNLTVKADGTATLVTRGSRPFTCKVDAATLDKLSQALQTADAAAVPERRPSKTPPIADEIYLTLIVGDKSIRYQDLGAAAETWKPVFQTMNQILASASALKNNTSDATGGVCTQ